MASDLTGKAQTVLGPVSGDELGITLPHEHFFEDDTCMFVEPTDLNERLFAHQPVTIDNVGHLRYTPHFNLDNRVSYDVENMICEAIDYRLAGGNTIVDCTPVNLGRNPDGLVRIAKAAGLHIIMGAGYYRQISLDPAMDERSVEEIRDEIVQDITVGVGSSKVRAGIIGEIGCSYPLADNEKKVLHAAAKAQQVTGAPLCIHPGYSETSALEIIDLLEGAGADINRTIMCHVDISVRKENTRRQLAQTGCYLEYDHIGKEEYYWTNVWTTDLPDDLRRLMEIEQLIESGYLNQILISQDIGYKCVRSSYGGIGYHHILLRFVPLMRRRGIGEDIIQTLLVENPKRIISFA